VLSQRFVELRRFAAKFCPTVENDRRKFRRISTRVRIPPLPPFLIFHRENDIQKPTMKSRSKNNSKNIAADNVDARLRSPAPQRSSWFVAPNEEKVSIVAMRVCNPDHSPARFNGCDITQAPTAFLEIVGDDFPVLHAMGV
jgi:hypothetical protein